MTPEYLLRSQSGKKTLHWEVVNAYFASGAKVLSWVIVSAVVYRWFGPLAFGFLALIRGTVGLFTYVAFGLSPAITVMLPKVHSEASEYESTQTSTIDYQRLRPTDETSLCSTAFVLAYAFCAAGLVVAICYAINYPHIHTVPVMFSQTYTTLVFMFAAGVLIRQVGDVSGAILQVKGRIAFDNLMVALTELVWAFSCVLMAFVSSEFSLKAVGWYFLLANLGLVIVRNVAAHRYVSLFHFRSIHPQLMRKLLSFGLLITLAQLADFLYAPVDYILINALLGNIEVAVYAPAVQIDAGLLLLVGGLSAVLLPKTAVAHAANDRATIRAYYIYGTLCSFGLLLVASIVVWGLSHRIFQLWLGDDMPATRAILPLLLIHTTLGGSSAVGRSILLGMGKVKTFTIAVLIAGVSNVILSYCFVKYLNLGLRGIVLGTIVVVVARCAIWMPWYVLRSIQQEKQIPPVQTDSTTVPLIP